MGWIAVRCGAALGRPWLLGVLVTAVALGLAGGSWTPAGAQGFELAAEPVSDAVAARALAEAERYAIVTYRYRGETMTGVAYKWGGRLSVDEYLAAVAQGAEPGRDVGVDASAVVVNAYLAADPDHRFVVEAGGGRRLVADVTSADLYRWNIRPVATDELRPGDLIFFQDERGNVSGVAVFERREGPNVHFIVASAGQGKVVRTFLNVNNTYWNTRVKGAGRLLAFSR